MSFPGNGDDTEREIQGKIQQILHPEHNSCVANTESATDDAGYESDSERFALDRDKKFLPAKDNITHFFYGLSSRNTKLAFEKDQTYLAAKWYLYVIEHQIPDIYQALNFTSTKMELNLTPEQKDTFVETLANSVWHRLKHDAALSIKGNSPLYLPWNGEYVRNALQQANINIAEADLMIFSFVGRKGLTTYQLGNETGKCSDFVNTAEPVARKMFN